MDVFFVMAVSEVKRCIEYGVILHFEMSSFEDLFTRNDYYVRLMADKQELDINLRN